MQSPNKLLDWAWIRVRRNLQGIIFSFFWVSLCQCFSAWMFSNKMIYNFCKQPINFLLKLQVHGNECENGGENLGAITFHPTANHTISPTRGSASQTRRQPRRPLRYHPFIVWAKFWPFWPFLTIFTIFCPILSGPITIFCTVKWVKCHFLTSFDQSIVII